MNAILDFIRAVAPWIAVGLAVAIVTVRTASRKKNNEKQDDTGDEKQDN